MELSNQNLPEMSKVVVLVFATKYQSCSNEELLLGVVFGFNLDLRLLPTVETRNLGTLILQITTEGKLYDDTNDHAKQTFVFSF